MNNRYTARTTDQTGGNPAGARIGDGAMIAAPMEV